MSDTKNINMNKFKFILKSIEFFTFNTTKTENLAACLEPKC
jgi:hypothetical protein